jgi:hypothetical protein
LQDVTQFPGRPLGGEPVEQVGGVFEIAWHGRVVGRLVAADDQIGQGSPERNRFERAVATAEAGLECSSPGWRVGPRTLITSPQQREKD